MLPGMLTTLTFVFLNSGRRPLSAQRPVHKHELTNVKLSKRTVLEAAVFGPNFEFGWLLNDTVPVVSLATQNGKMVQDAVYVTTLSSSSSYSSKGAQVAMVMAEPTELQEAVRHAWMSDADAAVYYGKSRNSQSNHKHKHKIKLWIRPVPAIEVGRSDGEQLVDTIRLTMASLPPDHTIALRMRQLDVPKPSTTRLPIAPSASSGPVKQVKGGLLGAIIISAALVLVLAVFLVFQLVAYWQKRSLFRSVRRGEVNIEELGIKRIKVPKTVIDKFIPVETYSGHGSTNANDSRATLRYDQEECPICLEEYKPGGKHEQIRVLPCKHYYHPRCIDKYLQTRSSLCPLCKRSCLPKGYLPPGVKITYATVRRAKRLARMRRTVRGGPTRWQRLLALFHRQHSATATATRQDVELGDRSGVGRQLPNLAALQQMQRVPTQEDEDEAYRHLPWYMKLRDAIVPV